MEYSFRMDIMGIDPDDGGPCGPRGMAVELSVEAEDQISAEALARIRVESILNEEHAIGDVFPIGFMGD